MLYKGFVEEIINVPPITLNECIYVQHLDVGFLLSWKQAYPCKIGPSCFLLRTKNRKNKQFSKSYEDRRFWQTQRIWTRFQFPQFVRTSMWNITNYLTKELKVLRDLAKESSSWDYNRVTKRRVSNLRYVKHYIVRTRSTRLLSNNYNGEGEKINRKLRMLGRILL